MLIDLNDDTKIGLQDSSGLEYYSIRSKNSIYLAKKRLAKVYHPETQADVTVTSLEDMDDFRLNQYIEYYPRVELAAGTYTGFDFSDLLSPVTIVGDDRALAGYTWYHKVPIDATNPPTGSGVGTCTITVSGNDLTIAGSTTNPDFTGWTNADYVLINDRETNSFHGDSTKTIIQISSIANNVLTLVSAPPPCIDATSCYTVTLLPNRKINENLTIANNISLYGFYLNAKSITVNGKENSLYFNNCVIYDNTIGVLAEKGASLSCGNSNTICKASDACIRIKDGTTNVDLSYVNTLGSSSTLIHIVNGSYAKLNYSRGSFSTSYGIWPNLSASCTAKYSHLYRVAVIAYDAEYGPCSIDAEYSTCRYNAYGAFAQWIGYAYLKNCSATWSNNTYNYGSKNAGYIEWS